MLNNLKQQWLPENLYSQVFKTYQLIKPYLQSTPLLESKIKFNNNAHVFLKCENLQFTNSFKYRGALAAILSYEHYDKSLWEKIKNYGVISCSSGNFGIGLAAVTSMLNIDFSVVIHKDVEPSKIKLILEANPNTNIITVDYEVWRNTMLTNYYPESPGIFVSSESNQYVTFGNSTIALEILTENPQTDAILVPYGGGNLAYSIASMAKYLNPNVKVYAVESDTGAPFMASYLAKKPVQVPYKKSFIDGIGSNFVIPSQYERLKTIIAGALTVSVNAVKKALVDLLLIDKILLEGAGAASFAATEIYLPLYKWKNACCVLTGGNIDPLTFTSILTSHNKQYAFP